MKFWKKSLVTGLLVSGGLWLGAAEMKTKHKIKRTERC